MNGTRRVALALVASLLLALVAVPPHEAGAQTKPEGEMRWALYVTLSPLWFDPAEVVGVITPFWVLFALHDALVKPMPGNNMFPSLAESWQESADGLAYEFKLRQGLKFHNGDPFTAEDVKFSFHRYKGVGVKLLHERVRSVDVLDPHRVRFALHKPWPDFLSVYGTPATGAAWIVPKSHIEKVGEDAFRRQPIGLGPYRFVRSTPGVELVLEANEQYWRKKPSIKHVVIKGVPDRATRLAMLKTGEADIGYLMVGIEAKTVKDDPKLRLVTTIPPATWYVDFPEQWNPRSPWNDRRVRLAAALAIDKQAINEAERMGLSRLTGSMVPSTMDLAMRIEPYPYDPAQAKKLLAAAGYPNGFDGGDITPVPPFVTMAEAVANYFGAIGIRTRVRAMERATFFESWRSKKLTGVIVGVSAAPGNAASRLENFVLSTAPYATGGYPDLDDIIRQQSLERDRKRRESLVHQVQKLMHERVMHAPIFEPATLHGVGPRVEEPAIGLNAQLFFAAPYEEMRLRKP